MLLKVVFFTIKKFSEAMHICFQKLKQPRTHKTTKAKPLAACLLLPPLPPTPHPRLGERDPGCPPTGSAQAHGPVSRESFLVFVSPNGTQAAPVVLPLVSPLTHSTVSTPGPACPLDAL